MNTKLMEELENALTFDNIMDEDFKSFNELTLLASSIKKEVSILFIHFVFWGENMNKEKHKHVVPNVRSKVQEL
jgi:methyltransferase-like protein